MKQTSKATYFLGMEKKILRRNVLISSFVVNVNESSCASYERIYVMSACGVVVKGIWMVSVM